MYIIAGGQFNVFINWKTSAMAKSFVEVGKKIDQKMKILLRGNAPTFFFLSSFQKQ